MPQRRSIVFGSLFVGGLLVIAWLEYYPASPMLEMIGLPGPRANSGLRCGSYYRQTVLGRVPTREMACRVPTIADPLERQEVRMDVLNRRIVHGVRLWRVPDSVRWKTEGDSVGLVLTRLGGHEFACPKNPFGHPPHVRGTRFWRFSKFYVRLVAYAWEEFPPERRWMLQLDGYPTLPPDCVKNAGNGLSREEVCNAEAVIRMPLPGKRTLCVKPNLWP